MVENDRDRKESTERPEESLHGADTDQSGRLQATTGSRWLQMAFNVSITSAYESPFPRTFA